MKVKKVIGLILVCFAIISTVAAQNPATIKVDELSDAKIRELMLKAEAMGYTDAQLETMAMAQGMSQTEMLKLRKRVEDIRKQDGTAGRSSQTAVIPDGVKENPARKLNYDRPDSLDKKVLSKDEMMAKAFDDLKPKIYGRDLFKNNSNSFEPDLRIPTPENYVFGPDDEVVIDLSGDNDLQRPYSLRVSPEGRIRIPLVGSVSIGGLRVDQAKARIRAAMIPYYPAIRNNTTTITVTLGNIRSIEVTLNGQVSTPGTYTLPSLATVFHALHASGGPNDNGSFRKIQLIRNGKVFREIDVYKFLQTGIQEDNIPLRDQDIINIPFYTSRVEVSGETKIQGYFELLPRESLSDLLGFAGGFSTEAYQARIKVIQNTSRERKITDIPASGFGAYIPTSGDKVFIEPILERFENRVELSGAVFRPSTYGLEPGLTLKKLIEKAGGVKEDAFMNRAYIYRLAADNSLVIVPVDLAGVLNGSSADVMLQREDKVVISSIMDLQEEYKVTIDGEVRNPGAYDFAKNMSVEDLVQIAGGFREGAAPSRISVSRRIKSTDLKVEGAITAEVFNIGVDKNLKIDGAPFILQPFDIVTIRSSEGYEVQKRVFIEGEVLRPGYYTIVSKNERISDLVNRAGGFTQLAYLEGASLKRPGNKNNEEYNRTLQNLKRLQEQGADTTSTKILESTIMSDLVGINLIKIMNEPLSRVDLILEEGDIIRVPKQLQTVRVTGEVLNPNNIVYLKGKTFKQYINSSGGYTINAYKRGVHVKYANGSIEAAKKFLFFNNYPVMKPGAEIVIPKKAVREPIKTQEILGIATGIASIAALLITILK